MDETQQQLIEELRLLRQAMTDFTTVTNATVMQQRDVSKTYVQKSRELTQAEIDIRNFAKELSFTGKAQTKQAKENEKDFKDAIQKIEQYGQKALSMLTPLQRQILLAEQKAIQSNEKYRMEVENLTETTSRLNEQQKLLRNITYDLNASFKDLRNTLLTQDLNLKKYSGALSGTFNAVTKTIEGLPDVLGKTNIGVKALSAGVAAITKTFGYLGVQALEYGDRILKNKDDLADFGAIGKFTSQELMDMAEGAQYTSATLQGWTKATKSLGTSIISLGTTVNDGVAEFAKVAEVSKEELANYRAMGLSQEQVTQGQADYVALLAKSGTIVTERMRADGSLAKSSKEYLSIVSELASIQGISRDEAKKQLEQSQNEYRFQARMFELSKERRQLEVAVDTGELTGADRAAAEERIQLLKTQETEFKRIVKEAYQTGGKEYATEVAGLIGAKGVMTTAEQAFRIGERGREQLAAAERGEVGVKGAFAQETKEQFDRLFEMFGGAQGVSLNPDAAKLIGAANAEFMEKMVTTYTRNEIQAAREAEKGVDAGTKGETPAKTADIAEKMRDDFFRMQTAAQATLDKLSKATLPKLQNLTGMLGDVLRDNERALKNILDYIKNNPNMSLTYIAALSGALGVLGSLIMAAAGKYALTGLFKKGVAGAGGSGGAASSTATIPTATTTGREIPKPAPFAEKTAAELRDMKPSERAAYREARAEHARQAEMAERRARRIQIVEEGRATQQAAKAAETAKIATAANKALGVLGKLGTLGAIGAGGYAAYEGLQTAETGEEKGAALGKGTGIAAGSIGGGLAGAKLGATLGIAGGPIGVLVGGILGGLAGGMFGSKLGETIGEKVGGAAGKALSESKEDEKELKESDKIEKINFALNKSVIELTKSIEKLTSVIGGPNKLASGDADQSTGAPQISVAPSKPFEGNKKEFTDKLYNTLLAEARKQGLSNPEVIAQLGTAQSSLETGYGKHLAGGNNYFGIKDFRKGQGNTQQTKEFINGQWVTINDKFRSYGSMEESAQDYIRFLMQNPRYSKVLESGTREDAARLIREAGYATDPQYTAKLLNIMSRMGVPAANTPSTVDTTYAADTTMATSIPGARTGGIFDGPSSGYLVELHGRETVVPTPDPNTRLAKTESTKETLTLGSIRPQEFLGVSSTDASSSISDKLATILEDVKSTLVAIDDKMASLNATQETALHTMM